MVDENGIECLGDWKGNPVGAGIVHAYETVSEDGRNWIFDLPWLLPIDEETILAHAGLEDPENWISRLGYRDSTNLEKYVTCIYWVIQTIFTVGYGDIPAMTTIELYP